MSQPPPGYGPPPSYPPPGYPPPGYIPNAGTNGKAVASLIVAIASIFCCPPAGIVAIILARSAKADIRSSGGYQSGRDLATAGEVIGWIVIVLTLVSIPVLFAMEGISNQMHGAVQPNVSTLGTTLHQ